MNEIVDDSLQQIDTKSRTSYLKRLGHLEKQLMDLEKELNSIIILKKP